MKPLLLLALVALGSACSSQGMLGDDIEVEVETSAIDPEALSDDGDAQADIVPGETVKKQASRRTESVFDQESIPSAPTAERASGLAMVRAPELRTQPFTHQGALLNAYYFVRGEGSWVDLAQRIYQDPGVAEDLKAWNPRTRITTGAVVYYRSAVRPSDDLVMKSFSEDFGFMPESYTVQKGDTISKIAQARLGSVHSWREIAAANAGVTNINAIAPGMTLAIPPMDVDNAGILRQMAAVQLQEQRRANAVAEENARRSAPQVDSQSAGARSIASNSEPSAAVAGTQSQGGNPEDSGSDSYSSAAPGGLRMPAALQGAVDRVVAASEGLPVPPQVVVGALAVLIGGAFLLRRRTG